MSKISDKRLDIAKIAIEKAGTYLMDNFLKSHILKIKSDNTSQLKEDIRSENIIIDLIHKSFPNDSFLAEEREQTINSDYVWVIDPLCGTLSYYRGIETWSISIALIFNHQYKYGLVYQPILNNLTIGIVGEGAFCNGRNLELSTTNQLQKSFVSVEHNVLIDGKVDILRLARDIKRLRIGHGSGNELAYIAGGQLDALIKTSQSPEHYSGGRVILESVGGVFVDFQGHKIPVILDKNVKIDYIATNKYLLDKLLLYIER
jgi:myo-inositol-1(or 4)-monophosphatase